MKTTQREPLTDRQQEVFCFLFDFMRANKFPPTVREIMDHFGMASTNGVMCHLNALEKKGYVAVVANASRGIELIDFPHCPYCGHRRQA